MRTYYIHSVILSKVLVMQRTTSILGSLKAKSFVSNKGDPIYITHTPNEGARTQSTKAHKYTYIENRSILNISTSRYIPRTTKFTLIGK